MRKIYPTDLSGEKWALLRTRLPELHRTVRMRTHSLRDVFDAVLLRLEEWLPLAALARLLPPWSTIYYHFRRFFLAALALRLHGPSHGRAGKDWQGSRCLCGYRGRPKREDHKNVKGRKRHPFVDTLGLPLSVLYVTPADVQARVGARLLLAGLRPLVPRLKKVWVDGAYSGKEQDGARSREGGNRGRRVRQGGGQGLREVLPKRWIVERTFGWLRRVRRLAKDYERKVQTSETLIEVAMILLMLRLLATAV